MNDYVTTKPQPIAEPDEQRASPLAGLSFCCWGGAILVLLFSISAGGSLSVGQHMQVLLYSCLVYAPLLALGTVLGVRSFRAPGTRTAIAMTVTLLNASTLLPAALAFPNAVSYLVQFG